MDLSDYRKKRSFAKTPEPEGGSSEDSEALEFVVQKHAASHLHYDFRLEMNGVLKSWAVPKGPSMNPADKRLAMMVEDHPYDYRTFEGVIPEGNYGAGSVIVWDKGTYSPLEPQNGTKKQQEKVLLKNLKKGKLSFTLHGKKLRGEFSLVYINGKQENAWLLIKKEDKYSSTEDVTEKDRSVISRKTVESIGKSTKRTGKEKVGFIDTLLSGYGDNMSLSPVPTKIRPMLATLIEEPFDNNDWLFEIKWDGYRAIATVVGTKVTLESRNGLPFTERYHTITSALQEAKYDVVLDGEIVVVNEQGLPEFQKLQSWQSEEAGNLIYYVFDILWLNGYDLTSLPIGKRKELLEKVIPKSKYIHYSDHIIGNGVSFFKAVKAHGGEGIIAKSLESTYEIGVRSNQWLKIKTQNRQEVVITGYTKSRGNRSHFGALILGIQKNNELVYVGHTGSGFTKDSLEQIWHLLQPLRTKDSPFEHPPKTNMPATWVKPKLIAEVKFQEWTKDGCLRQPIFLGLRPDKDLKAVVKEIPISNGHKNESKNMSSNQKNDIISDQKVLIKKIGKNEVKLTNLDKVYWKKEGYTKGDVINYYHKIAQYILPYLKDRPHSLNRHPNGINGKNFYQKDVEGKVPGWITTHADFSESNNKTIHYFVCRDEASLLYMANLGCIEIHPWHSVVATPDNPDYCIIDLDPLEISFDKVIETALVVKEVLDELDIRSYPKTSGATGIHIYIPLGGKYLYNESRLIAQILATEVQKRIPSITSIERSPTKRRRKVYIDYLQNRQGQTIAAPYSIRPKPKATVSTPLHWEEVKKGLTPEKYTIETIFDRLRSEGEIFTPVLKKSAITKKHIQSLDRGGISNNT
jgi:bifunctional non-homologous end joining protein LigD